MQFNEILRNLIEERELTQKQTAAELHIPVSTMGGYVQGTSEPDFSTLKLIAEYFGVSADYMLDMRDKKSVSREEDELLRIFRSLSAEQRILYLEQGRVFLKFSPKEEATLLKPTLNSGTYR